MEERIERKIIIGLITNTEYLQQLKSEWKQEYIESPTARIVSDWCWEYFDEFKRAPLQDIEGVYIKKLRSGLNKDLAEEIESEILPELSEEYSKNSITIDFLLTETRAYFVERQIQLHEEKLRYLREKRQIGEAKKEIETFRLIEGGKETGVDLSDRSVLIKLEKAFRESYEPLIRFPGALGKFWNDELRRGGFVALMGMAKRGKTYWLLEFMMRAYKQKRNIVFFQAGDMTENEQLIRISTYLARKSMRERDCGVVYRPVQDCIKNQMDTCNKKIRECNFGVFEEISDRKKITKQMLLDAIKCNQDYRHCYNCLEWQSEKWGSAWIKKIIINDPLEFEEAKELFEKFFIKTGRSIKMKSYPNSTLTVTEMERVLDVYEREEGFVPDVIILDYADLLLPEMNGEFRHQQNHIWKRLRGLSQDKNALLITVTQTDAQSYKADRLEMGHFTEDRRKYDHVTAMYGLNQDKDGREKEIGIMRFNKIVLREGDFHTTHEVHVLQQLKIGMPFLGSYY